jgi:hypothetical protein
MKIKRTRAPKRIFAKIERDVLERTFEECRESFKKVGRIFNMTGKQVKKQMLAFGLDIGGIKRDILSQFTQEHIIDCYDRYETLEKAGNELGVSIETLRKYLIANNIEYTLRQKFHQNDNFFTEDNEGSFYWAGFIAADGNVEKDSNRIKLELGIDDKGHVEKFKNDIQSDCPIRIARTYETRPEFKRPYYESAIIRFNSEQMAKDLLRFNIIPNKSKTYEVPDWLTIHPLYHHFLRGLIDGDGWVRVDGGHSIIGLCGSNVVLKIYEQFKWFLNRPHYVVRDDGLQIINCRNLVDNTNILKFLLKDATIWLDRKHEAALEILKIVPRKLDISKQVLIDLIQKTSLAGGFKNKTIYEYLDEYGDNLGCSKSTIIRRLKEYKLYYTPSP